jgi:hypothetical protein
VYNAFVSFEVQIASQVVKNFVDVEVLPEAAAALKSSPGRRSLYRNLSMINSLLDKHPRCLGLYLRLFLLTTSTAMSNTSL